MKKRTIKESGEAVKSEAGRRCASRRMKLFNAAQRLGAVLMHSDGWIAAVCTQSDQCHPFGRTKPPVVPGTNDIDPECNLEDWEGITPENKAKRDDTSGKVERIKDGIGFDEIKPYSGQTRNVGCAESAWCLCGTLSGHYGWSDFPSKSMFDFYTMRGRNPIIVFMSMNTGRMYMYANSQGHEEFANEQDSWDGNPAPTGNQASVQVKWMNEKFIPENPDFLVLFKQVLKKYFPRAAAEKDLEWDNRSEEIHRKEINGENV